MKFSSSLKLLLAVALLAVLAPSGALAKKKKRKAKSSESEIEGYGMSRDEILAEHKKLKSKYKNPKGDQGDLMHMADEMADGVRDADSEFNRALRTKVSPKCRKEIEDYTRKMKAGKKAKEPSINCKGELGAAMEGTNAYQKIQKQIKT